MTNRKNKKRLKKIALAFCTGAIVITGVTVGVTWNGLDIGSYLKGQDTYSTFIDKNYVDPSSVNINISGAGEKSDLYIP
mgnify:CR=1 FL=1